MYHIFLIHSSLNGHLGCFHILAIVNSGEWTERCMYLFQWKFCLDRCPGVRLLDHMVDLYLVFWGIFILLSIVVVPIYIPSNTVGEFPVLQTLSSICYLLFAIPMTIMMWYLTIVLICISLIISIFSYAWWPPVCLLWRIVYLVLLPIFQLGCWNFWCWVVWVVSIFWRLSLCQLHHCQLFSPIL